MKSIKVKGTNENYFAEVAKCDKEGLIITAGCIDGNEVSLVISKANWEKLKKL